MPEIEPQSEFDVVKLHLDRLWEEVSWRRENEQKITTGSIGFFGVLLTIVYSSNLDIKWYQGLVITPFPLVLGIFVGWYLWQNAEKRKAVSRVIVKLNKSLGAWEPGYLITGESLYPEKWKAWGSVPFRKSKVSSRYLWFVSIAALLSSIGIGMRCFL
jgi:hypothetical protein